MPAGGVLLRGTLVPRFTNLMNDLGETGTACFIFKIKLLRDSMILCKRVSCLFDFALKNFAVFKLQVFRLLDFEDQIFWDRDKLN